MAQDAVRVVEEGAQRLSRNPLSTGQHSQPPPWPQVLDHPAMAFTYILRCSDGSYYVGSTTTLEARVHQHQVGLGAVYTRTRRPVELVWAGEFETIPEAFAFEKKVQGWSRKKREALIEGRFDRLPGLASRAWRFRDGR